MLLGAMLVLVAACAKSPDAKEQARYQKTIETNILTRFIDSGDFTGGKPVLFAVVKTTPDDPEALQCTYYAQTQSGGVMSINGTQTITTPIRIFRIADNAPRFSELSQRDAGVLLEEAQTHGAETYRVSQILGTRKGELYEPFPRNEATGERRFIFESCK